MSTRRFANIGGWIMIVIGIVALFPFFSQLPSESPYLGYRISYGIFLGLFPMNILNKLALIAFGFAGVIASKKNSMRPSLLFSKTVFWVMGAVAVLGVIPTTYTLFGYWPLFGLEALAHATFAILGAYFGYVVPAREAHRPVRHA